MRKLIPLFGAALLAATGCTFSRTVVNPSVAAMDTSWIKPGETTREQVVERFGYPMTSAADGVFGFEPDAFRYTAKDTFETRFEPGYYITPVFSKEKGGNGHDILIVFDADGKVALLSRTETRDGKVKILEYKEAKK